METNQQINKTGSFIPKPSQPSEKKLKKERLQKERKQLIGLRRKKIKKYWSVSMIEIETTTAELTCPTPINLSSLYAIEVNRKKDKMFI